MTFYIVFVVEVHRSNTALVSFRDFFNNIKQSLNGSIYKILANLCIHNLTELSFRPQLLILMSIDKTVIHILFVVDSAGDSSQSALIRSPLRSTRRKTLSSTSADALGESKGVTCFYCRNKGFVDILELV